jgi:hypothetical protein
MWIEDVMKSNSLPANITIHRLHGPLIGTVEVKNREGLTSALASQLRRNLIAHGAEQDVQYFLLFSQDRGFLWHNRGRSDSAAPPDAEFPMDPVIHRYLPTNGPGRLRNSELETIIFSWLADTSELTAVPSTEPERTLALAGFLDAIRGGTFTRAA